MRYKIIFFTFLYFYGCISQEISVRREINLKGLNEKIAVLDFEKSGFFVNNKIGKFTADRLSESLYINANVSVVDRSQINNIVSEKNIPPITSLSMHKLKEIGELLNARYVVLGKVENLGESDISSTSLSGKILLTFRIVDTQNGAIAGMVSISRKIDMNAESTITLMINKMVKALY
jgi:hypothetical protein